MPPITINGIEYELMPLYFSVHDHIFSRYKTKYYKNLGGYMLRPTGKTVEPFVTRLPEQIKHGDGSIQYAKNIGVNEKGQLVPMPPESIKKEVSNG